MKRPPWGLMVFGPLLGLVFACGTSRSHRAAWALEPEAGRPDTCPEHPVDPGGVDGGPGPMDVRCSYRGAAGGQLIQVRGRVHGETETVLPEPLADVEVSIRRVGDVAVLGRARTDMQGGFSLSVVLRPGTYRLVASSVDVVLVERVMDVKEGVRTMSDLDLFVPLDPRLRSPDRS